MDDFLKRFHFREILKDFAIQDWFDSSDKAIRGIFETSDHHQIWITDDSSIGHCIFITDTKGVNKNKLLIINNFTQKELYLWRIDGKLYKKDTRCDCAIIHDNLLHLIEFKANAQNESSAAIEENYAKAMDQLGTTLTTLESQYNHCQKKIWDFFSDIDAQVVFNPTVPQKTALQQSTAVKFLKEYGIKLNFGNTLDI